jgi:hypothetical protein
MEGVLDLNSEILTWESLGETFGFAPVAEVPGNPSLVLWIKPTALITNNI